MGIMNHSECMKENPDGPAVAIQEWWHALTGGQGHISASLDRWNSSLKAAFLVLFRNAVVQRCLGCLLVIFGVAVIVLRLVEATDWTWVMVNMVLKVASWL
jgi:hypothetical protein